MTVAELEERVKALEQEMSQVRMLLSGRDRKKDWRRTVGGFADDPTFAEIVKLGEEWRSKQNDYSEE